MYMRLRGSIVASPYMNSGDGWRRSNSWRTPSNSCGHVDERRANDVYRLVHPSRLPLKSSARRPARQRPILGACPSNRD